MNFASALTEEVFKRLILPGLILFKKEYGQRRANDINKAVEYGQILDDHITT